MWKTARRKKDFSLQPFTLVWYRSGVVQKDAIGGRFFMIEMQPGSIERLLEFARLPNDFYVRNSRLVWLGYRLHHECKNWKVCSDSVAEGVVLEMLAHAVRQQKRSKNSNPAGYGE